MENQNGKRTVQAGYFIALKYFKNNDLPEQIENNLKKTEDDYQKHLKPFVQAPSIRDDLEIYTVSNPIETEFNGDDEVFVGSHHLVGIIVKIKNLE